MVIKPNWVFCANINLCTHILSHSPGPFSTCLCTFSGNILINIINNWLSEELIRRIRPFPLSQNDTCYPYSFARSCSATVNLVAKERVLYDGLYGLFPQFLIVGIGGNSLSSHVTTTNKLLAYILPQSI